MHETMYGIYLLFVPQQEIRLDNNLYHKIQGINQTHKARVRHGTNRH